MGEEGGGEEGVQGEEVAGDQRTGDQRGTSGVDLPMHILREPIASLFKHINGIIKLSWKLRPSKW